VITLNKNTQVNQLIGKLGEAGLNYLPEAVMLWRCQCADENPSSKLEI